MLGPVEGYHRGVSCISISTRLFIVQCLRWQMLPALHSGIPPPEMGYTSTWSVWEITDGSDILGYLLIPYGPGELFHPCALAYRDLSWPCCDTSSASGTPFSHATGIAG